MKCFENYGLAYDKWQWEIIKFHAIHSLKERGKEEIHISIIIT